MVDKMELGTIQKIYDYSSYSYDETNYGGDT